LRDSSLHIIENKSVSDQSKKNSGTFFFQPKLSINPPDDRYEREADSVAEHVMRKPINSTYFGDVSINSVQRMCTDCKEEELQRKENSKSEVEAGDELENYIGNINSGGSKLPSNVRSFFEPRFGYDFSNVKIHNDSVASKSAKSINALAYTSGNNIVFNENQFSPETDSGKKLLAHELTHVVQQVNGIQRTIAYDPKGKEEFVVNPAINVKDKKKYMGLTKPTINSNELKSSNPLRDPKYSFENGSCKFEDVVDKLSHKMQLPVKTDWKTMVSIDDAKKLLAQSERDKLVCDLGQIPLVVKGNPDNDSRTEEIRKHETGHVKDLKQLYDSIFLPWSKLFAGKVNKGVISASQKEECIKEFYKGMTKKDDLYKEFIEKFVELDKAYHDSSAGKTAQPKIKEFTCRKILFEL
jgi:hypothetical protein